MTLIAITSIVFCLPLMGNTADLVSQELRKKLEVERSQKEQLERRLQTVTDEIAVAMEAAKRDATAAQQQVGNAASA